jgi:arylsulfatase A-like enzyme
MILITLDTTRADHLSCYGYHRQTSPNLDKLANECLVYTRAIAPSSWTLPSHASLFTGKFTSSHGAEYDSHGPLRLLDAIEGPDVWEVHRARGLPQNERTLARILRKTGYVTGAVVGGPWLKQIFGLDKGFDYYDDTQIGTLNGRLARDVTASAVNWIEKSSKNKFFLFLNYFDPHGPYKPSEGFAHAFVSKPWQLREKRIALYDGEILYMDHYIGEFLEYLRARNLYENTFIIVTSDHGELLGEHDRFGHGKYLTQQELHVPLLLKYPDGEVSPGQTDAPVQVNDIFAIILERLGIEMPQGIQAGTPPDIGHPLFAEVYPAPAVTSAGDWRAIFEGDFKFVWNSKGDHRLFHLKNDPAELVNLALEQPERAAHMLSKMNQYLASLPKPGPAPSPQTVDEDTKKALKSLGYVN